MMFKIKSRSSGLALLMTIASLLGFAYMAFMGLEYMLPENRLLVEKNLVSEENLLDANQLLAAIMSVVGAALLFFCIRWACWGKATRKKHKGLVIEILSLLAIVALLFLGRVAFSRFIYVIENKQEIESLVTEARATALSIDTTYYIYAQERVKAYHKYLKGDSSRTQKTSSLRRRLLLDDEMLNIVSQEREDWLGQMDDSINVWNPATPKNLHYIIQASDDWVRQYANVSSLIYEGEKIEPFKMDDGDFKNRYIDFMKRYKTDIWSHLAMAFCCVAILTYYIQCRRAKNKFEGRRA